MFTINRSTTYGDLKERPVRNGHEETRRTRDGETSIRPETVFPACDRAGGTGNWRRRAWRPDGSQSAYLRGTGVAGIPGGAVPPQGSTAPRDVEDCEQYGNVGTAWRH